MKKRLVAYFSATGTTASAAASLAKACEADLYEIRPQIPYENKDLNWMNPFSRSTREMRGKAPHPALADRDADLTPYDEIFLCFPVWWYVAPTIINSFLEAYDFAGKRIVLFATSGGSGLGKAAEKLRPSVSETAVIENGFMLNGALSVQELKEKLAAAGL